MTSLLCPFTFPPGYWCRPSHHSASRVVLWFPPTAQPVPGLGGWLRQSGCRCLGSQFLAGGSALLLTGPAWVLSALLSACPQPSSHGSRTPGVLLPW